MEFIVCAHELRSFEFKVEADTLDLAIQEVKKDPFKFSAMKCGDYVDDSFEINQEVTESENEKDFVSDLLEHDWMAEMSDDVDLRTKELKDRHYLKRWSMGTKLSEKIYNDLALHGYSDEEIKRWNEQREIYKKAYGII